MRPATAHLVLLRAFTAATAAAACGLLLPGSAEAQRLPYRLLPESTFQVRTATDGVLGGFAHEHLVRADSVAGTIRIDPDALDRTHLDLTIPTDHLRVATDADEGDREEIRASMLGQVLAADEHPEIRFTSRHGTLTDEGVTLIASLTLAGVTRGVLVPLEVTTRADTLQARGTFTVKQTHFDIEPYSFGFGTIRVADEVRFEVDVAVVPRR